jgi:cellobiose transport system substrate-binding protein
MSFFSSKSRTRAAVVAAAATALFLGVAVAPAKAGGATPVTLTIWTFGDVIQRNMIQEYKILHPEVTLQIKQSNLDDLDGQGLTTACKAQTGPDIAAVEISYSGYWRSYPQCFQDLNKMQTSNANEGPGGIPAGQTASTIAKNYLTWRWDDGVAYNGTVIGYPTDVGGLEVAYRTDLFKKAGLPTDPTAVSKLWPTWDAFIATGQKYVTKLSATDKKAGKAFIDDAGTLYAAVLHQGTSAYYKNNGTQAGQLIYDTNPQVKQAWDTDIKALKSGIGARISEYTSDWYIGMNNGAFATILAPAWMMEYIKGEAPMTSGKWNIAQIPGSGGNQGGTQLTISSYSQNKQAAYDFLSWYTAPAQELQVFKTYGLFPAASSLYSDSAIQTYTDPFFNNAPIGKIYSTGVQKLKPIFQGPFQRTIDQAIGAGIGRVAAKKQTAEKSWAQVLSDIKKAVNN